MLTLRFLLLVCCLAGVHADYDCVCSYETEAKVYEAPDVKSKVIGYMYEFDCKPRYADATPVPGWLILASEHQVGYLQDKSSNEVQKCQGSMPDEDKVTTISTQPPITQTSTTTTHMPTTTTTTAKTTTTTTTTTPIPVTTTTNTTTKPTTTTTTTTPRSLTSSTTTTPKPTTTTTTTTPMPTTTTTTTTPRPTTTTTTPIPTTTYTPHCPSSVTSRSQLPYIYKHGSYCYEFRSHLQDWNHAKSDCRNNGGFLLSIHSQDEQEFVMTMMNRLRKFNPIWLGLFDSEHEEQWQWVSGTPLKYSNWMPDRMHDKYHGTEDCGLYVPARHGQWDDVQCTGFLLDTPATHPWICQYHLV